MKIILGVGGGIAAYKSAELARLQEREKNLERELRTAQRGTTTPAVALDEVVVARVGEAVELAFEGHVEAAAPRPLALQCAGDPATRGSRLPVPQRRPSA